MFGAITGVVTRFSMHRTLQKSGFRPGILLVFHLIAALLLLSWWWEGTVTREWWDGLDRAVFFTLNGSLADGGAWARFWAMANHRSFDLASALLVAVLYARFALAEDRRYLVERIALFFAIFLFTLVMIEFSNGTLEELKRHSASMVLEPVYRLTELVPDINAKDYSASSFPGDHATVLLMFTGYFWFAAGWRYGVIVALIALLFSMPRVVGGAHWFTDDVVGSGSIALVGLAWFFGTPLHRMVQGWMMPLGRRLAPLVEWILRPFSSAR